MTFDPRTTVSVGGRKLSKNIYVGVADLGQRPVAKQRWWANVVCSCRSANWSHAPHHGKLASTGILYLSYNNNAEDPMTVPAGDVWKYDTGPCSLDADHTASVAPQRRVWVWRIELGCREPEYDCCGRAGTNGGPTRKFFRSQDGGNTWNLIWNADFANPWPNIVVPNYTLSYASVAPWLTFGATPATCTATGTTNSLCPQPTPKLGWMVESLEIDPFNSNHMLYWHGRNHVWHEQRSRPPGTPAVRPTYPWLLWGSKKRQCKDLISSPAGTAHLISAVGDHTPALLHTQ